MEIKLDLDKDFEEQIDRLSKKYGEKFEMINGFSNKNLNFTSFIDNFIDCETVADASIDGNANVSAKDITVLEQEMMKPHKKLLGFNKVYCDTKKMYGKELADRWLEAEWDGTFYMHNSHAISFRPYCFAYDLQDLAEKGLFFLDKFGALPAKHLDTFNQHLLQFISYNCNHTTGAVGIPNYLVYSMYFWMKDVESGYTKNPEQYRDQQFQSFIFNCNQPFLRITESAFTNLTIFDQDYYISLFGERKFPDGSACIDYLDEFMEYQKAFMRVLAKVRKEQYMTFPVMTYSLLYKDGKFANPEFARWCSDHNTEWCDSNFYLGNDVTVLSNCCRLLSDTTKLKGFVNSIGGTSLKIGSAVVNTINLRRLALITTDEDEYLELLDKTTDDCVKMLDVVRHILKRNIEKGLLPNYTHGLISLENQFNTIGITAVYEMLNEFGYVGTDEFGNKFYTKKAKKFLTKVFEVLTKYTDDDRFDYSINIECVPAEKANVVLCEKDNLLYPEKDRGDYIYSNQWVPLKDRCTLTEKMEVGAEFDKKCGGGAISHINLNERFANKDQAWEMLNEIARKGLIYSAFNLKTNVCKNGHGFFGDKCPVCGEPVDTVFSRVVGFLTPTKSWSAPRKKEFNERKWYNI